MVHLISCVICNTFRISDALDLLGFAQIEEKEVHCITSFLIPTTCLKWKYGLKQLGHEEFKENQDDVTH